MFLAQYQVLRENGHTPSEAFNETVEEATQSLYPLIGAKGMDYMVRGWSSALSHICLHMLISESNCFISFIRCHLQYAACSTTARRGALDWAPKFYDANLPVFKALYQSVRDGSETRRSLEFNGRKTYSQDLAKELAEIDAQEIWRAGKTVRSKLDFESPLQYAKCLY
jgi:ketol-acid reductoisomerase